VHPVGNIYEIVLVPALTAVTLPDKLIVAMAISELPHVPSGVRQLIISKPPTHAFNVPVRLAGDRFTNIPVVLRQPLAAV
jgi:hypothetical protein